MPNITGRSSRLRQQPQPQPQPQLGVNLTEPFSAATTTSGPRYSDLKRRSDWHDRLNAFMFSAIQLSSEIKLDWDAVTCTSWVGEVIDCITGVNPYIDAGMEGKHSTPEGAAKLILAEGFKTLDELVAAWFIEVPVALAQRGDICLVPVREVGGDEDFDRVVIPNALAMVDGPIFWCVNPEGLSRGPMAQAIRAFAVGHVPVAMNTSHALKG